MVGHSEAGKGQGWHLNLVSLVPEPAMFISHCVACIRTMGTLRPFRGLPGPSKTL